MVAGFLYPSLGNIWHMIIVLNYLTLSLKGALSVTLTINCAEYMSLTLTKIILVLCLLR